jgi:hypothetical protein
MREFVDEVLRHCVPARRFAFDARRFAHTGGVGYCVNVDASVSDFVREYHKRAYLAGRRGNDLYPTPAERAHATRHFEGL